MNPEQIKLHDLMLEKLKNNLSGNGFDVLITENGKDAVKHLSGMIPVDACIGYGGSRTLEESGFFTMFNRADYPNLLDRNTPDLSFDAKMAIQRKSLTADFFICSVNAVSLAGDLILIDKWGNRNGAATFGPGKRVFIIGVNKIAPTLEEAMDRAKNKSAVLNNIRFDTGNPCTKTGKCMNCNSEKRLCSVTTIISRCQPAHSALIILVKSELGF